MLYLSLLYQFPTWLQRLYKGVLWRADSEDKSVYLTFDDGPIPEYTSRVLDILAHYGVKATFFMVGENAARYPDLVERVRNEGHAIGNHTYHHLRGCRVDLETYISDVQQANQILDTRLFRPPHGRMSWAQKKALQALGYRIVLWDVLTHDYNPRYSAEYMMKIIKRYTRNGSIITMHDSLKSGERMLELLPHLIEWLVAQGYTIQPLKL